MTKKIFKNKSIPDLQNLVEELKAELFALRFQSATGQLEKPHRIKEIRREVARILTFLQSKKAEGHVIKPLNIEKIIISNKLQENLDAKTKTLENKVKVNSVVQDVLKDVTKAVPITTAKEAKEPAVIDVIEEPQIAPSKDDINMKRGQNDGKK